MSDQPAEDGPHYQGPEADETETGDAPVEEPTEPQPWPNQTLVVDGVVPTEEVDQDPDLFADDDDPEMEMED
jgi:hypothetical protein